jgi:hypothetical protein
MMRFGYFLYVLGFIALAQAAEIVSGGNSTLCICAAKDEIRGWLTLYGFLAVGLVCLLGCGLAVLAGVIFSSLLQKGKTRPLRA